MGLRILHLGPSYLPDIGGSALRIKRLIQPLVNQNLCEMNIVLTKYDIRGRKIYSQEVKDYEVIEGVHVYRVNDVHAMPWFTRRICIERKIDLIHAHNPRFALVNYLSFCGKPLILEVHSFFNTTLPKQVLTKLSYLLSKKIIVLSTSAQKFLMEKHHISSEKIEVISNGVDINTFGISKDDKRGEHIRAKYGIKEKFIVGYLGTFFDWQGPADLVKAIPHILIEEEDVKFLLVGNGPDFERTKKIAYQLGVENKVIFPGIVAPHEVPKYISSMDVFVIPRPSTLATETAVPLKLLEAMAMKRAIVATSVGGLLEVIENGKNGILIKPSNERELANSILELLSNPSLRKKIGEKAWQTVAKKYDWNNCAEKLLRLYYEVNNKT